MNVEKIGASKDVETLQTGEASAKLFKEKIERFLVGDGMGRDEKTTKRLDVRQVKRKVRGWHG